MRKTIIEKNKKNELKINIAKMEALKSVISLIVEKTLFTTILTKLNKLELNDYKSFDYLVENSAEEILKNEEVIEEISKVYSMDDKEIIFDKESFDKFLNKVSAILTVDKLKEFLSAYDCKTYNREKMINAGKILAEKITGDCVDVVAVK